MYLRFQMQPPGTVEPVRQAARSLWRMHPFVDASTVRYLYEYCSVLSPHPCVYNCAAWSWRYLVSLAPNGQIYIFINDEDDRVVECILISGLWS